MDDHDAILAANEAFYAAFRAGDHAAMDALWSARRDVACVHPGSEPLHSRADTLDSWREILDGSTPIQCIHPRVHQLGDAAFVICGEQMPGGVLVATNVFVREGGDWRMVHHHAGPGVGPRGEDGLN